MHKFLFTKSYLLKRPSVIRYYNDFQKSQWDQIELQEKNQKEQLRRLIAFAYSNVPYYTKLFDYLKLKPDDIIEIKDLEKLPILTKKDIKENWQDFSPRNITIKHVSGSTGGSTGQTLKYKMSLEDYERGISLLYRGLGYGGYTLGDQIAVIAGSSLIPSSGTDLKKKFKDFFLNLRHYSSFEMSEKNLTEYFHDINRWKPLFLRGYASSLYLFAKFIRDKDLKLEFRPEAIFSISEKLFAKQRELIEQVFNTAVFDTYGLNDGGVSAYECEKHCGMHIDVERAVLEIVDNENKQVTNQEGRIIATSLYNYAFPFVRYDTGDLGIISDLKCSCGRETLLLKEIIGRTTDFLKLNNVIIGSPVLTVLMGTFDIEQYQIIQENVNSVACRIVKGKTYNELNNEEYIRKSFYSHVGNINIKFEYMDTIPVEQGGKHKFIVNLTNEGQ